MTPKERLKGLLNIPYAVAVGSVGTAIASVFGMGWQAILAFGLIVGLVWGLFFDKKPPGLRKDGSWVVAMILATVFVGIPYFIL
jgi:fatty acid desaturase